MSASVSLPDAAAAQQCMGDGCLVTLGTKKGMYEFWFNRHGQI